ncbi:TlpA family protein disulfide reductase [Pedobacter metabolipauper]|nr:TlpA disulfide reductase family protein [Pedobacter metabolipauper]
MTDRTRFEKGAANFVKNPGFLNICRQIFKPEKSETKEVNNNLGRLIYKTDIKYDVNGLLANYSFDSTVTYKSSTKLFSERRVITRLNHADKESKTLKLAYQELYPNGYINNDPSAVWKLDALLKKYEDNKLENSEEFYTKQIELIDRHMPANDYEYWNKRLEVSLYIGDDLDDLLEKVPVTFMTNYLILIEKLSRNFEDLDADAFLSTLTRLYNTNDAGTEINIFTEDLDELINTEFAKKALTSTNSKERIFFDNFRAKILTAKNKRIAAPFLTLFDYIELSKSQDTDLIFKLLAEDSRSFSEYTWRYKLMTYDFLKKIKISDSVSTVYLDSILNGIQKDIKVIDSLAAGTNSDSYYWKRYRPKLRLLYKIYLSQAYSRKSESSPELKNSYEKLAREYRPDLKEIADLGLEIKIENDFLPNRPDEFYLSSAKDTDPDAYLEELTSMCIVEPLRYKTLESEYKRLHPEGNFKVYFNSQIKKYLPSVDFKLDDYLGSNFNSLDHKGKFIFIDFWGTWCGACLPEMGNIDAYFKSNQANTDLKVITIACFDKKENIQKYMSGNQYSFPVLMSDGIIEKKTKISHYPTKLLILPNGTYLPLPLRSDYKDLVGKYMKWHIE